MHPLAEFVHLRRTGPTTGASLMEVFIESLRTAFSRGMVPMSVAWGFAGALVGGLLAILHLRAARSSRVSPAVSSKVPDLLALVAQGESELLEFNSSVRWDWRQQKINKQLESVVVTAIAGLMNHEGGNLLIGVGDEGDIRGIEPDFRTSSHANWDGFERALINVVKSRLGAQYCMLTHCCLHQIGANSVCQVAVERAPTPVYFRDGNIERYFVRAGNTTRELDAHEAVEHVSGRRVAL